MISIEFLRQFRFGGYAIFDFGVSFLGIYLLSAFLSKIFLKIKVFVPKQNWLFLTLPVSIIFHILVGSMTPMTKYFIDINGHYFLKILILVLTFLGVRGIRLVRK